MNYLQKEPLNVGRQPELDIAKTISLFVIVMIHALHSFYIGDGDLISNTISTLDGRQMLGAPIFLFCLGSGIVYTSSQRTYKDLLKIGLKILIIAYVLNFLRFSIPIIILAALGVSPIPIDEFHFDSSDILHCAAISYFFFALCSKLKLKPLVILLISCLFSVIGFFLEGVSTGNAVSDFLCAPIWQTGDETGFPFLSMFLHCAAGYVFALFLIRTNNKTKFYLLSLAVGLGAVSIFCISCLIQYEIFGIKDFRSIGLDYSIQLVGESIITFSLCYFFSLITPKFLIKTTLRLSTEVTSVYCIHWIIISLLTLFVHLDSSVLITLIVLVIIALADVLSFVYYKVKRRLSILKQRDPQ